MSSNRNDLKQFQFPEASRDRKKVDIDGLRLIEAGKDSILQREELQKPDQFESKYDLRKSFAWDSAFFTSPGVLDPEELFETLNFHEGDNGVCNFELKEANALPSSESLAATRIGDCIARRSLAWDSAFFTCEGVLDQDELSKVNKGYKKSEMQTNILPGIEEEFWKSADSNSTIDSDYSLASLEFDLFDDMRASMQPYNKASDLVNSSSKFQSQTGLPKPNSSKRSDITSKFQIKPAPRRQTISMHGVAKMAKQAIHPLQAQLFKKHATQNGEQNISSSVKPEFGQANPLPTAITKRASLGANHLKMDTKVRKAASGKIMSKKPCFDDSGSVVPSPSPSSEKAPSRLRIGTRTSARSGCPRSVTIDKSPKQLRRKNDLLACDTSSRTPSRSLTRGRNELLDSHQPSPLPSTPNSSCTSLSSSNDCWSSESTSRNHVTSNSSDSENHSSDQPFVRNQSKKTRLAYGGSPLPTALSREIKPSGLRMPSPKIGFFDVENSRPLTPNGGLKFHSGMQGSSKTRSGVHYPNGTSNKTRNGKLQPPRMSTRSANMKEKKLSSQQSEKLIFKPNCTAITKVEGEKACQEFTFNGTIKSSVAPSFKAETNYDGLGSCSKEDNQIVQKPCVNQNEDFSAQALENQLHYSDDKENIFSFENQVDVLSKQIEAIDFRGDLVMEF
ncbi:hypothetical protein COLO4_23753 [Corchorus olitorius]|uniref:Uncharacterized protein n=1 Tax=Corchorus olitorius TaxID=93759 RepID=A0A1R3IEW8_9ROSI|nr:hypothetical protein COLO4_23753 [Corchorus olitorius]